MENNSALDLDADAINNETPMLCEDYIRIACDEEIPETHFDEFVDIIVQWYMDWGDLSLHSENITENLTQLRSALQKCRLEDVLRILSSKPASPNDYIIKQNKAYN